MLFHNGSKEMVNSGNSSIKNLGLRIVLAQDYPTPNDRFYKVNHISIQPISQLKHILLIR
jgi:hypothetical protein